jgi:DNA-binding NarL/FixJ family response regulator
LLTGRIGSAERAVAVSARGRRTTIAGQLLPPREVHMVEPHTLPILDALYAAANDPTTWPDAITAVADHVGAIGGMLVRNAQYPELSSCVVGRLSPEVSSLYVSQYTDNPWTRAAEVVPIGEVAVLSQLYDLREGQHLAWFADILQPTGIRDMAYLSLPGFTSATSVAGIAFCFTESGARDVHDAADRMRELRPHLKQSVLLSQRVDQVRFLGDRFHDLLNSSSHPVLLMSSSQHVITVNAAAEGFLRRQDGLSVDDSARVRATLSSDDRALREAIARVTASAHHGVGLRVILPIGRSLRVQLTALPRNVALPGPEPATEPAALVTIIDPHSGHDDKIPALIEAYGLTPGEALVASLLATGLGRASAAEHLHVSVETIKKHTTACFRKIGVTSQAGLAQAVSGLPIQPGMFRGSER